VRASIGTIVTEAQHVQGSIVFGHRRQTRHVSWSLVAVEGVEQSAVQHRLNLRPKRSSWNASAAANSTSIPRATPTHFPGLEKHETWGSDQLQTFFSQGYVSPSVSLWALHGTVLK
jgi:hypothetical protein